MEISVDSVVTKVTGQSSVPEPMVTDTTSTAAMDLSSASSQSMPPNEMTVWSPDDDEDDNDDQMLVDIIQTASDTALRSTGLTASAMVDSLMEGAMVSRDNRNSSFFEDDEDDEDDDDDDDEDGDNEDYWAHKNRNGNSGARIQILIGNHPIPSHMTVLQAIREFSVNPQATPAAAQSGVSAFDSDVINATSSIWTNTHCLR